MADGNKPEELLVMPVSGKYCEIVYAQKAYKIWKVNPGTPDSYGTKIPYDIAVYFLGKTPPVITLVPEIKNGKYVSHVLPEDQEKIKESLDRGFTGGYKNYNEQSKTSAELLKGGDPSDALKKTLELLESQVKKNNTLENQVEELTKRLTQLEKVKAPVPVSTQGGNDSSASQAS